ncbi:MAG: hypothetical protein EWM73_01774 [Nitrospira sp.]|nr:MAG: hypothetical protein EWM73_01774 [Nitrospira sp.]
MKAFAVTMISVLIFVGTVGPIALSELLAATTLTGSTVESIDSIGLTITVQTAGDGDKLSMPVVGPDVMKGVTVGEHVSLELDMQGRVVKIIKLAPAPKEEEAPDPGA